MNHKPERQMMRESQAWQRALLRWKPRSWLTEDWMFFWATVAVIEGIALAVAFVIMCRAYEVKPRTAYEGIESSGGSRGVGAVRMRVRADMAAADAALRGDSVPVPAAGVVAPSKAQRAIGGVSTSGHMAGHGAGVGECGLNLMQGTRVVAETHNLVFAGATPAPAPSSRAAARSSAKASRLINSRSGGPTNMGGLLAAGRPDRLPLISAGRGVSEGVPFRPNCGALRPALVLGVNFPLRWNAAECTQTGTDAGMDAGKGAVAGVAAAPFPNRGGMHSWRIPATGSEARPAEVKAS